jgi:APA family basic amino acid/polyamine antiporter
MSTLRPHIGLFGGTMIIVGSMIGSAIFLTPSTMAAHVPSPGLLIGLWIVGGLLTIVGALCYGELAAMAPHAGGQYVYLREAFGPLCGFLYGWTLFLVIQTGFNAAVSIAFAKYLGVFLPFLGEANVLVHVPLGEMSTLEGLPKFLQALEINTAQLVACGVIVLLTGVNMLGVREGSIVQNILTTLKIGGLAALICAGATHVGPGIENFTPLLPPAELWQAGFLAGVAVAFSQALFAYDAWNTATFVAEEVKNPQVNLPRALLLGTGGVTLLYVLTVMAYMSVVPVAEMGAIPENRIAQVAATRFFGPMGVNLVIVAILVSTFGCVNGLILGGARVIFAMAREGLFFRSCATLRAKTGSPVMALIFQGVWSCVLTLTGSYNDLLTYTTFASVLFGALTVLGLFRLRRTQPDRPRPYRCWGYPFTPALYLMIAVPFLVYVIQGDPKSTGIGLALVLSGLPVYWLLRRSA